MSHLLDPLPRVSHINWMAWAGVVIRNKNGPISPDHHCAIFSLYGVWLFFLISRYLLTLIIKTIVYYCYPHWMFHQDRIPMCDVIFGFSYLNFRIKEFILWSYRYPDTPSWAWGWWEGNVIRGRPKVKCLINVEAAIPKISSLSKF